MPPVRTIKPNGAELRRLREERGITVPQLARKIGRHPQSIWNIEGREPNTSKVFMHQIANALKVDYSAIVRDDGEENPEETDTADAA